VHPNFFSHVTFKKLSPCAKTLCQMLYMGYLIFIAHQDVLFVYHCYPHFTDEKTELRQADKFA
jgi:hypothetical protein